MDRRFVARGIAALAAILLAAVLAACGGSAPEPTFETIILNSNLGVGENRVLVGLIDRETNTPITGATVEARLFAPNADPGGAVVFEDPVAEVAFASHTLDINEEHLDGQTADITHGSSQRPVAHVVPRQSSPALPAHEGDLTTFYGAQIEFDRPGFWGVEVTATIDGKTYQPVQLRAGVLEHTSEPAVGDPAPRSEQATLADVGSIQDVSSSAQPVRAMLDDTIAEALDSGKPVVIAFVTPAFCQTQFCGPVLETVVVPMYQEYGDRVEFVHVEPYDLAQARQGSLQPVPTVEEWGLLAEPFVFIVDRDGRIAAKFEGIMDVEELRAAIEATLD